MPDSQPLHPENLALLAPPTPYRTHHAAGIFFCPVLFQGFLAYVAYKGVEEYRAILHGMYNAAYVPSPVAVDAQTAAPAERSELAAPSATRVPQSLGHGHHGIVAGMEAGGEASATRSSDAAAGTSGVVPPPWVARLHCTCALVLAAWYSAC